MSKRYPGNYITGNPVALSQSSNAGIWDLKDQYQATGNNTWQETDGIYEIARSLRFRAVSGATAYLERTPAVSGNRRVWTYSTWVKFGSNRINGNSVHFGYSPQYGGDGANESQMGLLADGTIRVYDAGGVSGYFNVSTTTTFRDETAWYHIVVAVNTTLASAVDRVKIFVNGVRQPITTTTQVSQNALTGWNHTYRHRIGAAGYTTNYSQAHDGQLAEINHIDGQELDPSYFGYTDSITGIWQPKPYTGSYGTNGFYLPFTDIFNVYGLGNDKKENTSLGVFAGTGGTPNTALSTLTTAQSKFGGTSLALAGYVMPGGLGSGYGVHFEEHKVDGKDFTIEFWYKGQASDTNFGNIDGVLSGYNYFCSKGRTNTSSNGWGIHLYSNGSVGWETFGGSGGNSGSVSTTGVNVLDNNWHHIAVTRASGTVRIFVDGTQYGTGTLNYTCDNTYGLNINGMWNYSDGSSITYKIGGYMDDFRMYTGIAKYTSNFTVPNNALPIGPADQYWGYVSCALPFNGNNGDSNYACYIPSHFYPNNLSLTAGANYDSLVDSPTNISVTATDVGGVVPGNYCTWNPLYALNVGAGARNILTNGNLTSTDANSATYNGAMIATMGVSSGKWYWEVTNTTASTYVPCNGIAFSSNITTEYAGISYVPYQQAIQLRVATSNTNLQTSVGNAANGDVIGIALDADNKTITFYKNNTIVGATQSYSSYQPTNPVFPAQWTVNQQGQVSVANFGQRAFTYTPPSGYKSLCSTNIAALGTTEVSKPAITPNKWMDTSLYGGSASIRNIVNSGFKPDLVWIKSRANTGSHHVYDSSRGASLAMFSDATSGDNSRPNSLISFNNDGFTVGTSSDGNTNLSGYSYAAWQWKQSPTSGFNIVTYTGNGTTQTISHNLGVTPAFAIYKARSGTTNWLVYHKSLNGGVNPQNYYMSLNSSASMPAALSNIFVPTSSNFSVTDYGAGNPSGVDMIAYLWAEVPGFSKVGSYVGNGSTDGPFVHTGFRPAFILTKNITTTGYWWEMVDNDRSPVNTSQNNLYANVTDTEYTGSSYYKDILSNGFKPRSTNAGHNSSGDTFIYIAFAESPFALNNRAR
jgi:hypothetical protein